MDNFLDLMDSIASILLELKAYRDTGLTPEQVQRLAKAKADGRLHISPCADGTRIFCLISEDEEELLDLDKRIIKDSYFHGYTEFEYGELGEKWFLNEFEAAEKELKERELNG